MKTIFLYITIFGIYFTSCTSFSKNKKHEDEKLDSLTNVNRLILYEGAWISNFKNEIFIRSLKKIIIATPSLYLDSLDGSSAANLEWLSYDMNLNKSIDSFVNEITNRKEFKWDVEGRKVTMNLCLEYRLSKELDSIALLFYKKYNTSP